MTTRILITDDHAMLRTGLRAWLDSQPDLLVVGEAADGTQAVRLAGELNPDLVLMDISIPGPGGGIGATRQIAEKFPHMRVLILTMHEDEDLLREAMRAGAAGYMVKRAVQSELIDAIRAVAQGNLYIHPVMTRVLLKGITPPVREFAGESVSQPCTEAPTEALTETLAETLTPREIEVARLIAGGYTSREVAQQLYISVRTVEFHRANLMGKLGFRSRVELMRYMEKQHL